MGLIDYFRISEAIINFFIIYLHELCPNSKWESSGRSTSRFQFRCCENNIETYTLFQNYAPSFVSSSKISLHSSVTLPHTLESITSDSTGKVSHSSWYVASSGYDARLSDPICYWGFMRPTGHTGKKSMINRGWWRCFLPGGPSLTLPSSNSWLETHFILLAKVIEYAVFQLSLSHCFVLIKTVLTWFEKILVV